jgi:hypothetical protein
MFEAKSNKTAKFAWGIVALLVIGAIAINMIGRSAEDIRTPLERMKASVRAECENLVRGQLKAPSTAKFLAVVDGWKVDEAKQEGYYGGYVDAQNSFGAMIRNNFICIYDARTQATRVYRIWE